MFKLVAFATLALATSKPSQCQARPPIPTETLNFYEITEVFETSPLVGVSDVYETTIVVQDEIHPHTKTEIFTDTTTDTEVCTSTAVVQTTVKKVIDKKETKTNTVYHTSAHVDVKKQTSTQTNTQTNTQYSTDYTTETAKSTRVVPETQKVVDWVTKTREVRVNAFSKVPELATSVLTSTAKVTMTEIKTHTDKKLEKTQETSTSTIIVPRTATEVTVETTTTDVPEYHTAKNAHVVSKKEIKTSYSTDLQSTTETIHSTDTVTNVNTVKETATEKRTAYAKAYETMVIPTTVKLTKVYTKTVGKPIDVKETKTETTTFSAEKTVAACDDEKHDKKGNGNGNAYAYGHCHSEGECDQYKNGGLWQPQAYGLCTATMRSGNSVVSDLFLEAIAPLAVTSDQQGQGVKSQGRGQRA